MDAVSLQQLLTQQAQQAQQFQLLMQQVMTSSQAATSAATSAHNIAAAATSKNPVLDEIKSIVNPRILEKCPMFDGSNEKWMEWSFVFHSVAGLIGLETSMEGALTVAESDMDFDSMETDHQARSKVLWYLLVNCCRGKALTIIRGGENRNGLLAWRRMHSEYQPLVGGRFNAMLMSLLSPSWSDGSRFDELLNIWETELTNYERQAGESISARFKIAVITKHAPQEYRSLVTIASSQCGGDYQKFRSHIMDSLISGMGFSASGVRDGGDAMQIGWVGSDKKCNNCGKPGHEKAQCWAAGGGGKSKG
jgi:hypothetical protein